MVEFLGFFGVVEDVVADALSASLPLEGDMAYGTVATPLFLGADVGSQGTMSGEDDDVVPVTPGTEWSASATTGAGDIAFWV